LTSTLINGSIQNMTEIKHEVELHRSDESAPKKYSLLTKILAIIGFSATVLLIVWLIVEGAKRLPEGFSSLANIAETIHDYKPLTEIVLTTDKEVVNSGESFVATWSDVHQSGTYTLEFTCKEGITITAQGTNRDALPFSCDEAISFPATTHKISITASSTKERFSNVTFKISFTDTENKSTLTDTATVRVVNATIPFGENRPEETERPQPEETKPTAPTQPNPTPQPIVTTVYPQSDPNGFIDLKVATLGAGTLVNGIFVPTAQYHRDTRNAIKFDIKNIGTKTSGTWTFTTRLPSGVVYESEPQIPLKPLEHVEFTLGFGIEDEDDDSAKITTTVSTKHDTNEANNTSVWTVVIIN